MIDRQRLLSDLRNLLRIFEADLRSRSKDVELPEVTPFQTYGGKA